MEAWDVIVVGGGPTGMTVAGELARAGRSVLVLERRAAVSPLSRAFGMHARTLELLDQRGIAADLIARGAVAPGLTLLGRARLSMLRLPSPFRFMLTIPQTAVDARLERYARDEGARVVRGAIVTALDQRDDGVLVTARRDGRDQVHHADYVVGADGVHSTVRGLLGMRFSGRAVLRSIMLCDARLADPPEAPISVRATGAAFTFIAPCGDGLHRVVVWDRHNQADDHAPVDEEQIRAGLVRAAGNDFGFGEARWLSRFHCDERQVAAYRDGRVFLAGDAAHVHSPAGAQGLNTGIQDAVNLGWKLAAVLDGADPRILDTYNAERHPVGRMVLRLSGAAIRAMTVRTAPMRMLRTAALTGLMRIPAVADRAALMFSGIGIRYGRERGDHPLVGTRADDIPLTPDGPAGPERLFDAFRDGGFLLVREAGSVSTAVIVPPSVEGPRVLRRADAGPGLLVRPDGYVAWAGDTATGAWRERFEEWTGRSVYRDGLPRYVPERHASAPRSWRSPGATPE